jgi:hypothetical protein
VVAERGVSTETVIVDLHVWAVGSAAYSCALSLVTHDESLALKQVWEWLSLSRRPDDPGRHRFDHDGWHFGVDSGFFGLRSHCLDLKPAVRGGPRNS